MLRILFLAEGDAERSSGSGSGTPLSVVRGLRALGHEVVTGDADLHGASKLLGAAVSLWPKRERWAVRYHMGAAPFAFRSAAARRLVARRQPTPDLVLQYGATFYPGDRVPYFLYCDSTIKIASRYPEFSWAGKMTARELAKAAANEARVYRGARKIFTFSNHVAEQLTADFAVPADRLTTVYAGPNNVAGPDRPAAARTPRPRNVLFVGREFARKGGPVLLRAFAQVRERFPDATLTIVGPQGLEVDEPGVTNLGYLSSDDPADRDRLLRAYSEAAVFCFPTLYEPFGLAVLEAMYAGLPCVATRGWAIPEMVVDGETGFTAPAGNADAFAAAVCRLLDDDFLAARMGTAARARAHRLFSWDAVTRSMSAQMMDGMGAAHGP